MIRPIFPRVEAFIHFLGRNLPPSGRGVRSNSGLRALWASADTMAMDSNNTTNLTHHFLIAMPGLDDPFFERTVTYLCQHTPEGALGLIINRPTETTLGEILHQLGIPILQDTPMNQPVYYGGPVQPDRGFVLHSPECSWNSTLRIKDQLCITTSRDILEALGRGEGPQHALLALGYAGWDKGQLEAELTQNTWLNAEAKAHVIFDRRAEERWQASADLVGIDLSRISLMAGHA